MSHRRLRAGDTDEHVVEQRAEVQSKWGQVDKFLERFGRIFLTVAIAISTWFIAHVVNPLNQIPGVVSHQQWQDSVESSKSARSDSLFRIVNAKLDHAEQDRSKMVDILAALAGLQCDQFTAREQRTSVLCRKLSLGE